MIPSWRKITFSEIKKIISENETIRDSLKSYSYFKAIFFHGILIIVLLKISQIVLGWHF
jgi:hypothetical protein